MALFDTRVADYAVDGYWLEDYSIDGFKVKSTSAVETLLVPVKFADAELAAQIIQDVWGARVTDVTASLPGAFSFGILADIDGEAGSNLTVSFESNFLTNSLSAVMAELTMNSNVSVEVSVFGPQDAEAELSSSWSQVTAAAHIQAGSASLFTIAELATIPTKIIAVNSDLVANFDLAAVSGQPTLDPYRRITVGAEDRIITILSEDRTLIVIGRLS